MENHYLPLGYLSGTNIQNNKSGNSNFAKLVRHTSPLTIACPIHTQETQINHFMWSHFPLYTYAANKRALRYHSTPKQIVPPLVTNVASLPEATRPTHSSLPSARYSAEKQKEKIKY